MEFVADESVDFGIIKSLRNNNADVLSILESHHGISDESVLKIANEYNRILITEDKDFGEIVHRMKLNHSGILLIRLNDMPRLYRIKESVITIVTHYENLKGNFAVLSSSGLRIKKN